MVRALAFAGTKDDIRDQARQFDGPVDTIILYSAYSRVGIEETRANHAGTLQVLATKSRNLLGWPVGGVETRKQRFFCCGQWEIVLGRRLERIRPT